MDVGAEGAEGAAALPPALPLPKLLKGLLLPKLPPALLLPDAGVGRAVPLAGAEACGARAPKAPWELL